MGKISPEEKIQWVEKIIHNKESIHSVASKLGIYCSTVDKWVRNYKSLGKDVFFRKGWTKRSAAEKEAAVLDYLAGNGSLRDICDKHKIADTRQLRTWIKQYNGHEELKDSGTGGTPMFFASTFWRMLQNIFGECCISKLEKVARLRVVAFLPAA